MSSNEDEKSTSESENTIRPKTYSKAPLLKSIADPKEDESSSSSKTTEGDEENSSTDEEENYRICQKIQGDEEEYFSVYGKLHVRLDTVEELTEPLSSGYFQDSTGAESLQTKASNHEENVYSLSEVEVFNATRALEYDLEELESSFRCISLRDENCDEEEEREEKGSIATYSSPSLREDEGLWEGKEQEHNEEQSFSTRRIVSVESTSSLAPSNLRNYVFKALTSSDDEDDDDDITRGKLYLVRDTSPESNSLEKHEFENDEKHSAEFIEVSLEECTQATEIKVESSPQDDELGQNSPIMDNDSGIEGISRSESAKPNNNVWTKLNKKVKNKFTRNKEDYIPRPTNPSLRNSSRDGEEAESTVPMLKLHIEELYIKLSKAEEDKQKIADEGYRRALSIQKEATQKIEGVYRAQAKQADLVDRLQSKLTEYKGQKEDLEKRLMEVGNVCHLAQTKLDETNDTLQETEGKLRRLEALHVSDTNVFDSAVRELTEKLKHLENLNSILRSQLKESQSSNDHIVGDVQKCESYWRDLKAHLESQEDKIEKKLTDLLLNENKCPKKGMDAANVLKLYGRLANFRKNFVSLKAESERDLLVMKNDIAKRSKELASACLQVYASSEYVLDKGKSIHVGSIEKVYSQSQKLKKDNKMLENQVNELEERNKHLKNETSGLVRKLREKEEIIFKSEVPPLEMGNLINESVASLSQLESYNFQLQHSLNDIAQIVLDDADRHEKEIINPIFALNSSHHPLSVESPSKKSSGETIGFSFRRRARSTSPAMVNSTLSAVQTALNHRHVQVHDLRIKLQSCQERLESMAQKAEDKSDALDNVERRIETERQESDSLKIKLDQMSREKTIALEKVETLFADKTKIEKSYALLKQELEDLSEDFDNLKEVCERDKKTLEMKLNKILQLQGSNERLKNELDKSRASNEDLEQKNSDLKKEILETKVLLEVNVENLEIVRQESDVILEDSSYKIHEEYESKISTLRKEESILKDLNETLNEEKDYLNNNFKLLEEEIKDLSFEKNELIHENKERLKEIKTIKESLNDSDSKFRELEMEHKSLKDLYNMEKSYREKIERDASHMRESKDSLDNQLTSVILRKDSLEDEICNVHREMKIVKNRLDGIGSENSELGRYRSDLEAKIEGLEREITILNDRNDRLQEERAAILSLNIDLQSQLAASDEMIKSLRNDKEEFSVKFESQADTIRNLKAELSEETLGIQTIRNDCDSKIYELKKLNESCLDNMRLQMEDLSKKILKEREEIEIDLKKKFNQELSTKDETITFLKEEVLSSNERINLLESKTEEDLILAENSKQKALQIADQERLMYAEKCRVMSGELENITSEFNKYKRESTAKSEDNRVSLMEALFELSKYKSQLESNALQYNEEKNRLSESINNYTKENLRLEEKIKSLQSNICDAENSLQRQKERIIECEKSLLESENSNDDLRNESHKLNRIISDLEHKTNLEEKSKFKLQETLRRLEVEKIGQRKQIKEYESKITIIESRERSVIEKMDNLQKKYEKITISYRSRDSSNEEMKSTLVDLQQRCKNLLKNCETLEKSRDEERQGKEDLENKCQKLLTQIDDCKNSKLKLEFQISSIESAHSLEKASLNAKLLYSKEVVEEARDHERILKRQKHELQTKYDFSEQSVKELSKSNAEHEKLKAEMKQRISDSEFEKRKLEDRLSGAHSVLALLGGENYNEHSFEHHKRNLQDQINKLNALQCEGDDLKNRLTLLKKENESITSHLNVSAREKKNLQFQIESSKQQLEKMELTISENDEKLANLDEKIHKKENEIIYLYKELSNAKSQIDDFKRIQAKGIDREVRRDDQKRELLENYDELKKRINALQVLRSSLEGDKKRLENASLEKDCEIKILKNKYEGLKKAAEYSEEKCVSLSQTVQKLRSDLEEVDSSSQQNIDLLIRSTDLNKAPNITAANLGTTEDEIKKLEERLEDSKSYIFELEKNQESLLSQVSQLQREIKRIRDGSTESNIVASLRLSNKSLQDNFESLSNNPSLVQDNSSEPRKNTKTANRIRMQIPLNIDKSSDCADHMIEIKFLQQKHDRNLRKIKGLEQQIEQQKEAYVSQIQKLLQDGHKDRCLDIKRQKQILDEKENYYKDRENLLREYVRELEEKIQSLKERLLLEIRRRSSYISDVSGHSSKITELRSHLDQSLEKVANFDLERELLESETSKLNKSIDRFGQSYLGKITPSKMNNQSVIKRAGSCGSIYNLAVSSTPVEHRKTNKRPQSPSSLRKRCLEF